MNWRRWLANGIWLSVIGLLVGGQAWFACADIKVHHACYAACGDTFEYKRWPEKTLACVEVGHKRVQAVCRADEHTAVIKDIEAPK